MSLVWLYAYSNCKETGADEETAGESSFDASRRIRARRDAQIQKPQRQTPEPQASDRDRPLRSASGGRQGKAAAAVKAAINALEKQFEIKSLEIKTQLRPAAGDLLS